MDTDLLSSVPAKMPGSFITETAASVAHRRGEEILGLPVVRGKTWNVTVVITPAEAKAIMLAMPKQRPLRASNVRYFKTLIESGRFKVTHQGIAFDKEGLLMDGQNRLTACIEADAAIEIQVSFNMERDLFDSIDRGHGRNAIDDLMCAALAKTSIEGRNLTSAVKIIWNIEKSFVPWAQVDRGGMSLSDTQDVMSRHPYLYDAVAYCDRHKKALRGIGPGSAAAFYTLFHEAHAPKADLFMEQIIKGENLRHGDPVYAFREYRRLGSGNAAFKTTRAASMIVLVRTWNAFVEGRQLNRVSSGIKSTTDANFPTISKGK